MLATGINKWHWPGPAIFPRTRTGWRHLFIRCRISRTVKNFLTVEVLFNEKYREMNETAKNTV
jgi:hypothetical protein